MWQVILLEHDIPHESFSGKVLACLPPQDWTITPENSVGRKDLRHLPVLSIDPPGCKDIDDALHARSLENGNLEVGAPRAIAGWLSGPCGSSSQHAGKNLRPKYPSARFRLYTSMYRRWAFISPM